MLSERIKLKDDDKLPPITSWFAPLYHGEGDSIIRKKNDKPKKWKKQYPDYCFSYTGLQKIKENVNEKKSELNPIGVNVHKHQKYVLIRNACQLHEDLRGPNGIIAMQFNGEVVTNAWLKFYEICNEFLCPLLEKISRSKSKTLVSFHLAEAPGNFILALNHFVKTKYPSVILDWRASTYRNTYKSNVPHFGDKYGLIKKYPERWFYGADSDGDILSPANIRSFRSCVDQNTKVLLVTSDVKIILGQEGAKMKGSDDISDYDDEENINIPAHLGQLLASLNILSKGGSMVLKILSLYESPTIAMIYLASHCFDKFYLCKPESSRPANSEIYMIGVGYKGNISSLQMDNLLNTMRYVRVLISPKGSPSIFKKEDIPRSFVKKIIKINEMLAESQIKNIDRNLRYFNKYKDSELGELNKKCATNRENTARLWIEKNNLESLRDEDKLL